MSMGRREPGETAELEQRRVIRGRVMRAPILALVVVAGCTGGSSPWTTIDSWYREAPDQTSGVWRKLPLSRVHMVDRERLAEAENLLIEDSAILVSAETAERLTKSKLGPGLHVLVRGLCLNCAGTGRFSVSVAEGAISVIHSSLASRPLPMNRWPLVLDLDSVPLEVFVETTSDR